MSNNKFFYAWVSCKQLRACKYQANGGLCKQFFTECACSEVVQNFFDCKVLKIYPYDLCSIFDIFKYKSTSIFRQFFFKICKTDFKIFFKIPILDIFVDIQLNPANSNPQGKWKIVRISGGSN